MQGAAGCYPLMRRKTARATVMKFCGFAVRLRPTQQCWFAIISPSPSFSLGRNLIHICGRARSFTVALRRGGLCISDPESDFPEIRLDVSRFNREAGISQVGGGEGTEARGREILRWLRSRLDYRFPGAETIFRVRRYPSSRSRARP